MLRVNLSDNQVLNLFLPGVLVELGILWVVCPLLPAPVDWFLGLIAQANGHDISHNGIFATGLLAVATLLAYLAALFLGSLIAILIGYIEAHYLDRWQARKLGISVSEYESQWDRYVDSLESHGKAGNSYVAKQVTAFHFEAQSFLGLIVVAAATSARPIEIFWPCLWPLGSLALAGFLAKAAVDDHFALASFRNRRFWMGAVETKSAEEIIQALIGRWCARHELGPLTIVLAKCTIRDERKGPLKKALKAVRRARGLPDTVVHPDEKQALARVEALLADRLDRARQKRK